MKWVSSSRGCCPAHQHQHRRQPSGAILSGRRWPFHPVGHSFVFHPKPLVLANPPFPAVIKQASIKTLQLLHDLSPPCCTIPAQKYIERLRYHASCCLYRLVSARCCCRSCSVTAVHVSVQLYSITTDIWNTKTYCSACSSQSHSQPLVCFTFVNYPLILCSTELWRHKAVERKL